MQIWITAYEENSSQKGWVQMFTFEVDPEAVGVSVCSLYATDVLRIIQYDFIEVSVVFILKHSNILGF